LEVVKVLCARGIDRSVINKQGHSAIDLVRDVDIGAEIQSYDPVDDDDLDDSMFARRCPLITSYETLYYNTCFTDDF
jgi:hypothetical protein